MIRLLIKLLSFISPNINLVFFSPIFFKLKRDISELSNAITFLASKNSIWRHNSEPIDPAAPVTSIVLFLIFGFILLMFSSLLPIISSIPIEKVSFRLN